MRAASPFDLANDGAYRAWRDRKLASAPATTGELLVAVSDPAKLSTAERRALAERCERANMAVYAAPPRSDGASDVPRQIGIQLGLHTLDVNYLADDDGITPLAATDTGPRSGFIPYTNRAIRWHTDGYYNPPERTVRGLLLHCVQSAATGGDNQLLDHEIAYILLRDENPEHIRALSAAGVMTIPPRNDENGIARPAQPGPVFSVDAAGFLHMRYTARTVSIAWKRDAATAAAVAALARLLETPTPWTLRGRLEPGMGLVSNNVLHDRSGFTETPTRRRLLYRARYYERVSGS